ncbi:MAG: enoyl-CoA hydratase-related protein [Pseudomonadota bacterium]
MEGPIRIIRSENIEGLHTVGPLYEWSEGKACLYIDAIEFKGKKGGILCYHNPPVHQVGNPGLDAYLEAMEIISKSRGTITFLILYSANDPVHAGGDLKESLTNLEKTLTLKKELESKGALPEEIDQLYAWGDRRLEKGFAVYRGIRRLAQDMRVVAICGGGTRYGGSAEIPLMADILVGDSRSGMCCSEAMIGLIPGWSGVGRAVTKAGLINARYMAEIGTEVKASQLKAMGIYNLVVEVPFSFPKKETTGDPEGDNARYQEALQNHNDETGLLLLPKALEVAACPERDIPRVGEDERLTPATPEALSAEAARRSNPYTYEGLWGKPLNEVRDELKALGRPLAPQSIGALEGLFADCDPFNFNEEQFVEAEMKVDARLYRDSRFRAGIVATLEQKVADFREERELREKELTEAKENMLVIAEHDKRRNL